MSDLDQPKRINVPVTIEDEMRRSYMDYAMSVIIGRALPDVRDGLKPAHRRVIYGMRTMGLTSSRAYRKCAKIVGEVMGNFHPHGDSSIYDTLVRLAQPFNMRYPLVDKQGNFGSVDGDPPAAMRYTEARLKPLSDDLMADIDRDTVDFVPNYDETTEEPTVLPAPFPNLLVNGSDGIAVGMATKIPPHNLREVVDGIIWAAQHPEASRETREQELLHRIPGPDFPTGGIIIGRAGIRHGYLTGRGSVVVRARTSVEAAGRKKDKDAIIVTEIPYQVNKSRLLEKIADLVQNKTIEGVSDLRDESDRSGMRIVIELRRGEVPEVVLNNLYKHTPLQTTFGINAVAIVGGRPRTLALIDLIDEFVDFRRDVVHRRTAHDLRKAEARTHILEGLRTALDHLDAIITLIRAAASPPEAKAALVAQYDLSETQAQAILDMQLQRLTGLERQKIQDELSELREKVEQLRAILQDEALLLDLVVGELREIQDEYGDDRRTEIAEDIDGEFTIEDLIVDEDVVITVSNTGYVKRTAVTEYRSQRRGGKGSIGMRMRDEDFLTHLFVASTHAYLMIFSDRGRVYPLKVHRIPEVGRDGRGKSIANLVPLAEGERVAALETLRDFPTEPGERFVVMGTRRGVAKRIDLSAFRHARPAGVIAMLVAEDDAVVGAELTDGQGQIFIGTRNGMAIRFAQDDLRPMGRVAVGVRAIKLRDDDEVVAMALVHARGTVLTVTENGYGKRTALDEYRVQSRAGVGIIGIRTAGRNGPVVGVAFVDGPEDAVLLITQQGKVLRMRAEDARLIGRATQGVRLIGIDAEDRVVSIAKFVNRAGVEAVEVDEPVEAGYASRSDGGAAEVELEKPGEPDGGSG
ncbi:MAG: DNA gyrase subunit A [Acidobacteria bacterium]|nr:DNA gyrase subunit A [Acidobacteriota bacterium]